MFAKLSVQWKVAASPMAFGGIFIVSLGYFSVEFGGAALVAATRSDLASAVNEKERALEFWRKHRLEMLVAVSESERYIGTGSSSTTVSPGLHGRRDGRIWTDDGLGNWVGPDKPFQSILVLDPDTGRVLIASDASEV